MAPASDKDCRSNEARRSSALRSFPWKQAVHDVVATNMLLRKVPPCHRVLVELSRHHMAIL
jgi:hypothetical protein